MDESSASTTPEKFSKDLADYKGTVLDVGQGTRNFLFKRHFGLTLLLIVLPVGLTILISYLEFFSNFINFSDAASLKGALFLAVAPLIVPGIYYWRVQSRMRALFYTELAALLGCSYSPEGYEPTGGQLFTFGHAHNVTNVLTGTYRDQPYRLYDYSYDEGYGKNRTTYHYTVGELETKAKLPHVLGTPIHWYNFMSGWQPAGTEPLTLEGNFNEKFKVYVAKDAQMESREILEPNVMEKLMAGYDTYSFECAGSNVYLFISGKMAENRDAVMGVYALLQRFSDILSPELQSFVREASTN